MVVGSDLARMLSESLATDQFHTQLEVWGIDPEAFGQLLGQYAEHAGAFHTDERTPPEEIVLTAMVAGFEVGYRCRLQVEGETKDMIIPDVLPL